MPQCDNNRVDDKNVCGELVDVEQCVKTHPLSYLARAACPVMCKLCYTTSTSTATTTSTSTSTSTDPRRCAEVDMYLKVEGKQPKTIRNEYKLPDKAAAGTQASGGSEDEKLKDCFGKCAVMPECSVVAFKRSKSQCHFYKNTAEMITTESKSSTSDWIMYNNVC